MRAWEITFLIIMLSQVSQIFIASIGLFPEDYMGMHGQVVTNSTTASGTGYSTGDYNDKTGQLLDAQKSSSVVDPVSFGFASVFSGLVMIIEIASVYVTVLPTLLIFFHCPLPIALVLQAIVYYSLIWSYAQWKAGRSGGMIQ
jgi:hypothetical protein